MLGWIVVGLAIIGNILVIKKSRYGFVLWFTANIVWIIDLTTQSPVQYSYVSLILFYQALNIWGWISWKNFGNDPAG